MLGGAVGTDVGVAAQPGGGSHIDDATPVGGQHVGQDGLGAVENTAEVDRQHVLQDGRIGLHERRTGSLAGIVDENFDGAETLAR